VKASGRFGDNRNPPLTYKGVGDGARAVGASEDLAEFSDGEVGLIVHPEHGVELLDGEAIGHGDVVADSSPVFKGVRQKVIIFVAKIWHILNFRP
jgi:hypothetical protein